MFTQGLSRCQPDTLLKDVLHPIFMVLSSLVAGVVCLGYLASASFMSLYTKTTGEFLIEGRNAAELSGPSCLVLIVITSMIWSVKAMIQAAIESVRDEEFLVGRRLHNIEH